MLSVLFAAEALLGATRCAWAQAPILDTPEKVWRDFRSDTPDLEVETIRSWHENQGDFETLRFTAERESGGRVRVFAIRGAPSQGTHLPGILHIHGGGQTASLEWVRFWTSRGYVCTTYDFTGPWAGRKEVTDWGPIKQGNLAQANGGFQVRPTPHESSWYHWAVVARRALTLLSYHPKVDRDRLGIFGVSIGGTLCWLVAATDDRVKTAVPIYGCGYNVDPRKTAWGFPDLDPDITLFKRALAPEAYAADIRHPLLLLDATNDFHGWMDNAYEILAKVSAPSRVAFTPRYNHHIDGAQGRNLPAWMDWQLRGGPPFPAEPKLDVRLDRDSEPVAHVRPADDSHVTKVDVFYTLGEKPSPNRFWRRAATAKMGKSWQARLPVVQIDDPLLAFANVYYQSGVCLSTNLSRATPARLGIARASLVWSASPAADLSEPGAPFVAATANTDPNISPAYFVRSDDSARPDAICVNPALFGDRINLDLVSHYIGDPGYAGRDDQALSFEYRGAFLQENKPKAAGGAPDVEGPGFTVQVTAHDWTPRAKTYVARVSVPQTATGWRKVTLSPSHFVAADKKPLSSWRDLDKIEIRGVGSKHDPPRFDHFEWAAR
ncbi:MAG TPA: acetylxylan esterase [Planctomycetaceae bacterium]|nr:acetylxylan esterase [Planctomycetaceae bacterium]